MNLKFRLTADFGDFLFNFGIYRRATELDRVDLSTDSGKEQFATLALASGNAQLVFDDVLDDPGSVQEITAQGGDVLGFFLIPDASLEQFQTNQAAFAVDGVAAFAFPGDERWPLFSWSDANPGSLDQMIGVYGTSTVTGQPTSMFAFEDLTRLGIPGNRLPSDLSFSDIVFTVEGVRAVPEPPSLVLLAAGATGLATLRRKRRSINSEAAPSGR